MVGGVRYEIFLYFVFVAWLVGGAGGRYAPRVACVYLALGIRLTLFRVRAAVVNIRELVFTSIAFPPLSVL